MRRDAFQPVAESTPFDNATNGFVATDVQAAIEEINNFVAQYASPGFTWGRSGNVPANTWLQNDTVPSNLTGRLVFMTGAAIRKIFISNENVNTFTIDIYEHDGITFTLLTTASVAAARSGFTTVNIPITTGKELAVKLGTGSAKNLVVSVLVSGNI